MDVKELAEDFWEDIKDRGYYIAGFLILIGIPFLKEVPGFPAIPILSEIYTILEALGLFGNHNFLVKMLTLCLIWAIFAASWDFLSGLTGQINFGHAIFFGIGAYTAFWFAMGFESIFGNYIILDPLPALIVGALISALVATLIGMIALRIKGPYLALVTLVIPLIVSSLIKLDYFSGVTGGDTGFINIPPIIKPTYQLDVDILTFYVFMLVIFFISLGILMFLAYSRLGIALQSIREDEDAAESLGINIQFYKIFAFTVSAFFAGIAGGMYAQFRNVTNPSFFESEFSFTIIIMVVIGGIGSISGGAIGAFLLTLLLTLFLEDIFPTSLIEGVSILAYGALLVISLRYMPYGLTRAKDDQKKGMVVGLLFAIFWIIMRGRSDFLAFQWITTPFASLTSFTIENILVVLLLLGMLIFTLPAIPIFWISESLGLFFLTELIGLPMNAQTTLKAVFLIDAVVGVMFAYYLPKIFKYFRLRFWGVWPSAGRYEPPD
jgi:branched-chain amino acid transport system permease protein